MVLIFLSFLAKRDKKKNGATTISMTKTNGHNTEHHTWSDAPVHPNLQ